jgi:hypothetical protein
LHKLCWRTLLKGVSLVVYQSRVTFSLRKPAS